jgi:membrane-bound inhibitor of C-type lysozyme
MNGKAWAILVIVVILVGAVVLYWTRDRTSEAVQSDQSDQSGQSAGTTIQATFNCESGKSVDAVFIYASTTSRVGNQVQLMLSDGRQMTLPQVISADGGRYANADESIVFWNVGNTATITENGTTTYSGCVTNG